MGASVQIENVTKIFKDNRSKSDLLALKSIQLDISPGEFLAVVGPSGCGKSTLLAIVAGLENCTEGQVSIDGEKVSGPNQKLGVMFQEYALFPWMSVKDNIEFGPRSRRIQREVYGPSCMNLIDLVGLTGFENNYPHQLSGGMRQRCALARTLANEPQVLLMDEPLAALDAQTRIILQGELLRIWGEHLPLDQRRTVFFVTHSIDEAVFLSDQIVVMCRRPGQVKAIIDNPLPRPRHNSIDQAEFAALNRRIWELIEQDVIEANAIVAS